MDALRKILLLTLTLAGSSFAANETLLIGSGDLLHIQVFDTPEMEQRPRVTDAGTIPVLFVGDLKVTNQTPAEAAHAIEKALIDKKYMQHPQVTVTVEQYATQTVSVMGQVAKPGAYPINTPRSVIDILSLAGGLTDLADRHILIQRHGDNTQTVNYFMSNHSDVALNDKVLVNPGDTVLVQRVGIVYVLGDVGRPGGFPMSTNDSAITVLQAVALAGSPNRTAVASKARLVRKTPAGGREEIPLSLAAMQKGKRPDITMQADDMIYVPFSFIKNLAVNGSGIAASATSAVIYAH